MADTTTLPQAFHTLEVFVESWALASSDQRMHKRMVSSMAEIQAFYDALLPVTEQALAHLDTFDLRALPAAETRLFHLLLAGAEAGLAVEVYGAPQLPLAPNQSRFKVTHTHMGG